MHFTLRFRSALWFAAMGVVLLSFGQARAQDRCAVRFTAEDAAIRGALQAAGFYDLPAGPAGQSLVGITAHIVRRSDGTGGIDPSVIDDAIQDATQYYLDTGIEFCRVGLTYIDSDEFYSIESWAELDALRETNPVPGTVNIYFTNQLQTEDGCDSPPCHWCGVSSYTWSDVQGIVMANDCTGIGKTAFPHELGHYFDLLHTHETGYCQECVDGSNCQTCGDQLCDTPADPGLSTDNVDNVCTYIGSERDPCNNDPYRPDTHNLMSSSRDACRDRFTAQQSDLVHATLLNLRPDHIRSSCDGLDWMTYLGGSAMDQSYGIAVDGAGNALVTGWTNSSDFEGRNNAFHGGSGDAFVAKVSRSGFGALQWMTYLGGSNEDWPLGVAVDGAGNALVTGRTDSTDFEGRNNAHHGGDYDVFVAKVSPSGALQWMTYLGGSGYEMSRGIAVDGDGNALVTGQTDSADFEGRINSRNGDSIIVDAFVAKVSPSGSLQWMRYWGGNDLDHGAGIAVDGDDNALVTGGTMWHFNGFDGGLNAYFADFDVFVLKVSPSGALLGMTHFGGSDDDEGYGIAVDGDGNALVTGLTDSDDFEGRNNAHHGGGTDAFVAKVNQPFFGAPQWMTYLGGSDSDYGFGIAVDGAGNALVTGPTSSTDFEGRTNATHGGREAFVAKVTPSGTLPWMTYLGGSGYDTGSGIAVDRAGNALVSGRTDSTDFEGRNNAHHGGLADAFVAKYGLSGGGGGGPDCTGRERISKAHCVDKKGVNQLRVTCARGSPGDTFTVTLSTGESKSGVLYGRKGKVKFRRLPSGPGTANATWGCGAEATKDYDCP